MSRALGNELPAVVVDGLDGPGEAQGQVTLVLTTDPDGRCHVSQLSAAQIAVVDRRTVRLAMWAGSAATSNAVRTGRLDLYRVDAGVAHTIRLECAPRAPIRLGSGPELARLDATVVEVVADVVPYADLVSPLTFRLRSPAEVLPLWMEIQRALLELGPPGGPSC